MDERFQVDDSTEPMEPIDVEYWIRKEGPGEIHKPKKQKPNPRINILLFILTFFTTTFAGTLFSADVESSSSIFLQLHKGLPFSLTLLTILLFHEFGHYFMAKKHRVEATLPYFIPAPSIIGTFGAIIKMRSPLHSKKSLLDIGAAGPLAGVVVAVPAVIIGLRLSEIQPVSDLKGGLSLGSSLLFSFLSKISIGVVPDNYDIVLHPIAFAGWIGLLVTMLNLLPVGQLDGGHVAYAVLGRQRHRMASYIVLPILFFLGIKAWQGWLIWCLLLLFLMGTKHPPTIDDHVPLDSGRKLIGWIALILFVLTFTPVPFSFNF
jgi:membrane-associated protease RseP (regulator of RpoE activity)